MAKKKKYPFEPKGFRADAIGLWGRLTGKGMVRREGMLVTMRRFSRPNHMVKIPFTKIQYAAGGPVFYFELRFAESPDVIQGYVNMQKTLNRIKKGECCGIQVDPNTLWVRKIWPLDRKLKWYQH
ncbi:MAG: hypothetical protein L3J33_08780 [Rhodobacteraceae bacterium]|nr:hypothetical protein [Paracoccaceae bacterium]